MFAVIITEKGGATRRQVFDKSEISIGRLQGNDVILVKGNVSKQHAKVTANGGAFFVADQNSTNGTYVNRKRIGEPTVVQEGDRIYIGDYVLAVEEERTLAGAEEEALARPTPPGQAAPAVPDLQSVSLSAPPAALAHVFSSLPPLEGFAPPAPKAHGVVRSERPPAAAPSPSPSEIATAAPVRPLQGKSSEQADLAALVGAVRQLVEATHARFTASAFQGEVEARLSATLEAFLQAQGSTVDAATLAAAGGVARVVAAARDELADTGPLGALLVDPTVNQITVDGTDGLWVQRAGQTLQRELRFSHPASVKGAVVRLARSAGLDVAGDLHGLRTVLPGGFSLEVLVLPGQRLLLALSRMGRVQTSLDGLLRRGTVSREVATVLRQCVLGRLNLLVVGARPGGTSDLLCALANAAPVTDAWLVIEQRDHFLLDATQVLCMSRAEVEGRLSETVSFLLGVSGMRLLVEDASGALAAGVLAALTGGGEGLVVAVPAQSIELAIDRLALDLVASGRGYDLQAGERALAAFGLVVQLGRLEDGRDQVLRVCELARDDNGGVRPVELFRFVGNAVDGAYVASGVEPALLPLLAARKVPLEPSLFHAPRAAVDPLAGLKP